MTSNTEMFTTIGRTYVQTPEAKKATPESEPKQHQRRAVEGLHQVENWLQKHGDYLFKYALFRLRDHAAAEDATQETFLAAMKAYERFERRGSERTWLVGILRHKIIDHFRRMSRQISLVDESDSMLADGDFFESAGSWRSHYAPVDWHTTPSELLERREFWRVLSDSLSKLPKRTAIAFTLREIDGLTSEEICDALSISVNNLWVMLHRARLHLRSCLEMNWLKTSGKVSF
jgi:RNA polymerase sigma-70 factor (ECF subfamily)